MKFKSSELHLSITGWSEYPEKGGEGNAKPLRRHMRGRRTINEGGQERDSTPR